MRYGNAYLLSESNFAYIRMSGYERQTKCIQKVEENEKKQEFYLL